MNCKDIGIDNCVFCENTELKTICWVEYYERHIDTMFCGNTRKAIIHYLTYCRSTDLQQYITAVIKHKYPEYEKLLVLI